MGFAHYMRHHTFGARVAPGVARLDPVAGCWLLVAGRWLPVAGYPLPAMRAISLFNIRPTIRA